MIDEVDGKIRLENKSKNKYEVSQPINIEWNNNYGKARD